MKKIVIAVLTAVMLVVGAGPALAGNYPAVVRWHMGIPRSDYIAELWRTDGTHNTVALIGETSGYGTQAEAWFYFYYAHGVVKCRFHEKMQHHTAFAHTCAGKADRVEMYYDKRYDGAGRHRVWVSPDW